MRPVTIPGSLSERQLTRQPRPIELGEEPRPGPVLLPDPGGERLRLKQRRPRARCSPADSTCLGRRMPDVGPPRDDSIVIAYGRRLLVPLLALVPLRPRSMNRSIDGSQWFGPSLLETAARLTVAWPSRIQPTARRRALRLWAGLGLMIVGVVGTLVSVSLLAPIAPHRMSEPLLTGVAVISALIVVAGAGLIPGGASASVLDRIGQLVSYMETALWRVAVGGSALLSASAGVLTALAWREDPGFAANETQFVALLITTLTMSVTFAMLAATVAPPLLSVRARRLQLKRAHITASTWAFVLCCALSALSISIVSADPDTLLPPAVFIGIITSLVLWVAARSRRLSAWHRDMLSAVTRAIEAAEDAKEAPHDSDRRRALAHRLREVVNEFSSSTFHFGPFSSQRKVEGELLTVLDFAISRLRGTRAPSSVERYPIVFEPYQDAPSAAFVWLSAAAMSELRIRLLGRAPDSRA